MANRVRNLARGGSLGANITANSFGRILTTVVSLVAIPIYVRLLGIEAYGLIGVYATLSGLSGMLDLGLKTTATRESALILGRGQGFQDIIDLLKILEWIYWFIGGLLAFLLFALAGPIAHHWLKVVALSPAEAQRAIQLAALAIGLNWPYGLYSSVLNGLQRQVTNNLILVSVTVLNAAGSLAILLFVSPTIHAFMIWQICCALTQMVWARLSIADLFRGHNVCWEAGAQELKKIWRFTAGMGVVTLEATLLLQLDRIILSGIFPFNVFGAYSLIVAFARPSTFFVNAVFTAILPRLTQLACALDKTGFARMFHQGAQLISLTLFPFAATMAYFSGPLLLIWTGNREAAEAARWAAPLLILAYSMESILVMPIALQYAAGSSRYVMIQLGTAITLAAPLITAGALLKGMVGATMGWVVADVVVLGIFSPVIINKFLPGEFLKWSLVDIIVPLGITILVGGISQAFLPGSFGKVACLIYIAATGAVIVGLAGLSLPVGRDTFLRCFGILRESFTS